MSNSAKERVLGDIRRSLKRRGALPESVARSLRERLASPTVNVRPSVEGDPVEHFVKKVEAVSGKVVRVDNLSQVSAAVVECLERYAVPLSIVAAPDPALDIPWSNRLTVERRAALDKDLVSVTGAFAGVAETGSVVLLSGPQSPTTLNFLPDYHFVILHAKQIVVHIEDVWTRLREVGGRMPRTVNFVTGPSKTGDVDQVIHEGAHGPRALHVLLVESS